MRDAREASDVSRNRKRALRKSKDYAEIWLLIELRINCSSQGPCRSLDISSLLPIFICSFPILRNPRQLDELERDVCHNGPVSFDPFPDTLY